MAKAFQHITLILFLGAFAPGASAHVVLDQTTAIAGTTGFLSFRIIHGCGDEPTLGLRVLLPFGVDYAVPRYKPGWTVERVETETSLDEQENGNANSNQIELRWTGGPLPPNTYDLFELEVRFPTTPGEKIYFKAIQECTESSIRYVTIPEKGDMPWDVQNPAPGILLQAPE